MQSRKILFGLLVFFSFWSWKMAIYIAKQYQLCCAGFSENFLLANTLVFAFSLGFIHNLCDKFHFYGFYYIALPIILFAHSHSRSESTKPREKKQKIVSININRIHSYTHIHLTNSLSGENSTKNGNRTRRQWREKREKSPLKSVSSDFSFGIFSAKALERKIHFRKYFSLWEPSARDAAWNRF